MTMTPMQRTPRLEPVHHGMLVVDVSDFGAPWRNDLDRVAVRHANERLVLRALGRAHVPAALALLDFEGDGILVLVDPRVSPLRLLDPLLPSLTEDLECHNRTVPTARQFHLRAAVHAGYVLRDSRGYVGADLNTAFRLVNAEPIRKVRASSAVPVVAITSNEVYRSVLRSGVGPIDMPGWERVRVREKETNAPAWLYLPGIGDPTPGSSDLELRGDLPCAG